MRLGLGVSLTGVGRAGLPDPLEQSAVGATGSGDYAGFKVAHVETFDNALATDLIRPGNPYGKYANNFSERDRRLTSSTSVGALADPYWTGWNDANDGVAVSSYSDVLSVGGGYIRCKGRKATTAEKALQGTRDNSSGPAYTDRPMAWAHPTMRSFAYRGERILEVRWRQTIPAAVDTTVSGANLANAIWELDVRGDSEAAEHGENDWYEYQNGNPAGATLCGAGGTFTAVDPHGALTDGSWQILRVKYLSSGITVETLTDDGVSLGSASFTTAAGQLDKTWYLMFGAFNVTLSRASTVFNEALWTGVEHSIDISSIRVWIPTTSSSLEPLVADATPVEIALNGTGSYVIPSQASLWGGAVDAEYIRFVHATDTNGPGRESEYDGPNDNDAADELPVGVTYNAGTRTVSFAATFSTQAGVIHGYVYPSKTAVGLVKPHRFAVYVKPKLSLPALTGATPGQAYSYQIPRGSPRNWDNGNCPHGSHSGLTMVSGPSWLSFDTATHTLSGNCPSDYTDTSVTFRCTNGAGIYTEQTLTLSAAWQPSALGASLAYAWDTTDTSATTDDGSGKVSQLRHLYDNAKYMARSTASERPSISTSGGPSSNKRVLVFTTAASQHLRATDGAGLTSAINVFDNANIQNSSGYICFSAKADATGVQRFLGLFASGGGTFWQYRHGASDRGISYQSASSATVTVSQASQDTNWHVIEIIKSTTSITVKVDGTSVATGTITQTNSLDANDLLLGAIISASVYTPGLNGQMGPGLIATAVPSSGDQTSARQWVANKMGITVS